MDWGNLSWWGNLWRLCSNIITQLRRSPNCGMGWLHPSSGRSSLWITLLMFSWSRWISFSVKLILNSKSVKNQLRMRMTFYKWLEKIKINISYLNTRWIWCSSIEYLRCSHKSYLIFLSTHVRNQYSICLEIVLLNSGSISDQLSLSNFWRLLWNTLEIKA